MAPQYPLDRHVWEDSAGVIFLNYGCRALLDCHISVQELPRDYGTKDAEIQSSVQIIRCVKLDLS